MSKVTLYPYQTASKDLIVEKRRVLLAMEMGTGKTPTTLAAMEELMVRESPRKTVLIVTPASLKFQWREEIKKFTPSTCTLIDGSPAARKKQYAEAEQTNPDYVITNYETLVLDFAWYDSIVWGALVCDECSYLSSYKSKRSKAVKKLAKDIPVRVGLTGYPIENGAAEALFSQFEVIDSTVLGKYWDFEQKYIKRNPQGWITGYRNLPHLAQRIAPVTARKRQSDADVKRYLPDVRMVPPQIVRWDAKGKRLYRRISQDLISLLDEARQNYGTSWSGFNIASIYDDGKERFDPEEMALRAEIMSRITALRMLCDHPELLRRSAKLFEDRITDSTGAQAGSAYAFLLSSRGWLDDLTSTPKFKAVTKYLDDFLKINPEHKAVIFSQYRYMVDILHAQFRDEYGAVEYHGGLSSRQKSEKKRIFDLGYKNRVFVSTDAGGMGLNLQTANLIINYDLPWTAGRKAQRDSRIIRAGSRWSQVTIESFLMDNSLEIRQEQALTHKGDVAAAILDNGATDQQGNVLTSVTSLYDILVGMVNA